MKKLMYLVVAVFSMNAAVAQTVATKQELPARKTVTMEDRAKRSTAVMVQELGLNNDQQAKVYALKLEKMNKAQEVRKANKDKKDTLKKEVKAINQDYRTALKEILTADQYTKWEATVAKRKETAKAKAQRSKEPSKNTEEEDDLQQTIMD